MQMCIRDRLCAVAEGVDGIVVNLDDEAVRAARRCGQRHRRNEAVDAGGVARVDNDRQMRQLVQRCV